MKTTLKKILLASMLLSVAMSSILFSMDSVESTAPSQMTDESRRSLKIASLLVEFKADVNSKSSNVTTLLMFTVDQNNLDPVKSLFESKAGFNSEKETAVPQ